MKRIYPFTYAAAILSLAGVAYYIQKGLGGWIGLFAGVLVGVIATLGMIALYEHTFLKLGDLVWEPKFWDAVYGTSFGRTVAVMELSWNLATLPWWKRKNLAPAAMVYAAYLGLMLAWLGTGFKPIESGDPVAYALNAATRLLSQAVPAVLVRSS